MGDGRGEAGAHARQGRRAGGGGGIAHRRPRAEKWSTDQQLLYLVQSALYYLRVPPPRAGGPAAHACTIYGFAEKRPEKRKSPRRLALAVASARTHLERETRRRARLSHPRATSASRDRGRRLVALERTPPRPPGTSFRINRRRQPTLDSRRPRARCPRASLGSRRASPRGASGRPATVRALSSPPASRASRPRASARRLPPARCSIRAARRRTRTPP